jgi:4,5-dihydroxyphthalate decarboxylase
MLLDGEPDAVLGESSPDPPLFGDPQDEAKRWYDRHGVVPVNHIVVMRWDDPEMVREIYRLLLESKLRAVSPGTPDPIPFGIEPNRATLAWIAEYAFQQKLIPKRIAVDDMFRETRELLD